jgi:hypothetical protein
MNAALPLITWPPDQRFKWPQLLQGIRGHHLLRPLYRSRCYAFIVSSAQPSACHRAESRFFVDGNAAAGFNTEAMSSILRRPLSNIDKKQWHDFEAQ